MLADTCIDIDHRGSSAVCRTPPWPPQPPEAISSWGRISKRSPAAELELLHNIVLSFAQRDRVVEAKGPKGRLPNQAHTYRGPDDIAVVILHAAGRTGR
jgi:hypothetical protein